MVLAFILCVVVVECLIAYLCIPSVTPAEVLAGPATHAQPPVEASHAKDTKEKGGESAPEQSEVDLGEFTVMAFQPASNSTLRIAFHLYGTVGASDATEFAARLKESQHRFREQVIVTLRSAEVTDLTDAGLGLLKRTILEKTNAILGKPLLKTVIFSDFSFVELQ